MKTTAVIIQCRLSSSRLPSKAIMPLGGSTVLEWTLNAMKKVRADRYFVATDEASYDVLEPICKENGYECFAGPLENVLERYCLLIKKIDADVVIRATADNPFLFYEAAQYSLDEFLKRDSNPCDYLTLTGLPHGSGVEVFSGKSLLKAAALTDSDYDREHVGPALYNHKENFNCVFMPSPSRFNHPELRTTIDTFSDYMRAVAAVSSSELTASGQNSTELILAAMNNPSVNNPVILVPSVVKGCGTGHLYRCLEIALEKKFFVYIPQEHSLEETDGIVKAFIEKGLDESHIINNLPDETYKAVIITDLFKTDENQLDLFKNAKSVIAIDEGSDSEFFDYRLDVIPSYDENSANYVEPAFIKKAGKLRNSHADEWNAFCNVLVCIGGEDPAGLTIPSAKTIKKVLPDANVTAVLSDKVYAEFIKNQAADYEESGIKVVETIPDLKNHIADYDLVVTHYGLTAFEASSAGCAVILLPTTKLHEKLAQKYGYAFLYKNFSENELIQVLKSESIYPQHLKDSGSKSLADFLQELSYGVRLCCPVCGEENNTGSDAVISRNSTRTYRKCSSCGMIYISWTSVPEKKYKKSYFFEEYKNQYGKTYQEDFESIKNQGKRRLSVIKPLIGFSKDKNLLDIGCAYGPFLSASSDYGFNVFGTDISEDAVDYVQNNLHFPAAVSAFPEIDIASEFGISAFDIVTMWYVIEHFKDLDAVLKKICGITKKHGIFAFSTPSAEGISAKSNSDHFYEISPSDHYSVWEPSNAAKILKRYGFSVERIVSTGHHPERFPSIQKFGAEKDSLQWKLTDKLSHLRHLGDTVEIYCRKL